MTNAGDLDAKELLYYDKPQVIEVRDGSENMIRQIFFPSLDHDPPPWWP